MQPSIQAYDQLLFDTEVSQNGPKGSGAVLVYLPTIGSVFDERHQ